MDTLPQYGSHAFVPYLPASPSPAQEELPPLTLLNTSTWTYCGPILSPTSSALPPSFHAWARRTISGHLLPRLLPFLSFLDSFLKAAGAQHYWLTLRATKPTDEYDTVRWHTDDIFFDHEGEDRRTRKRSRSSYWKLATTLLGPSTLFLPNASSARLVLRKAKNEEQARREHTCSSFRCVPCHDTIEALRHRLASEFVSEKPETGSYGTAAFFRLGDEEGAVHSEPPCHEDRIFVNVVPGTETELRELMARWGMGFPRDWCFGVPASLEEQYPSLLGRDESGKSRADSAMCTEEGSESEAEGSVSRSMSTSASTSTMNVNLAIEYEDWLRYKGFQFSEVFGVQEAKS